MMEPQIFYQLEQMPFTKQTRLKTLYPTEDTSEMLERLEYLKKTKGLAVFTGRSGTGKTSTLRQFVQSLNPALYKVIYLKMSSVSVTEFFRELAAEFGIEAGYRKADVFLQIQNEMEYYVTEKRCTPLIIIDEAQYLSQSILRDLVMLLNFDMDSKDCCILILAGLPQLNATLKRSANDSLRQRIMVNYNTKGITIEEAKKYVVGVLEECGCKDPVFSPEAIEAAVRLANGSVRDLNHLLNLSIIEGAEKEIRLIPADIISRAQAEREL